MHSSFHGAAGRVFDLRTRRQHLVVVVLLPLVLASLTIAIVPLLGSITARGTGDGVVVVDDLSMLLVPGGMFATLIAVVVAACSNFPADRVRYGRWPLAVAAGALVSQAVALLLPIDTPMLVSLPLAALAALVAGSAGHRIAGRMIGDYELPTTSAPAPPDAVRRSIPDAGTAIWAGRSPSMPAKIWVPAMLPVGLYIALAFLSGFLYFLGFAALYSAVTVVKYTNLRMRLTVGPRGISVRTGVFKRERLGIELGNVESARHANAPAASVWSPGWESRRDRLSFLTRKGSALTVRLTDGTEMVISLDDSGEAAAVINGLLDRRVVASSQGVIGTC